MASSSPSSPSLYLARSSSSGGGYNENNNHVGSLDSEESFSSTFCSNDNDAASNTNSLVADLQSHLTDTEISDVELIGTDGKSVVAVRSILAMRSRFFKKLLFGAFAESNLQQVELGYSSLVLRAVVEYCYTDDLKTAFENLSFEETARSMVGLVAAGNYFDLGGLQRKAYRLTCLMMDEYPALACAVLDESLLQENGATLARVALGIIRLRTESALLPSGHEYLGVQSLGIQSMEQVMADQEIRTNELSLFLCLQKWANHSPNRKQVASQLCNRIDFAKIAPSDLCTIVAESGIVSSEMLLAAYREQALQAERQRMVFSQLRACTANNTISGKMIVQGAGLQAVNGTYTASLKGAMRYTKPGRLSGVGKGEFYLHTCVLLDDTKKWFLTFRGSNKSMDLYSAPLLGEEAFDPPPMQTWLAIVPNHVQLRSLAQEFHGKKKISSMADGNAGDPPPICIWLPDETEQ